MVISTKCLPIALFVTIFSPLSLLAQPDIQVPPSWTQPNEPFRIVGNLYYVGSADLTSYLFVTPKGNILLDAGVPENAPMVEANIKKLGFRVQDIKILLNSHAHFDHAGGLKALKDASRAKLIVSGPDAELMARGGKLDFAFGSKYLYPPVQADEILKDHQQVELGGTTLIAHITPGHTKGCTTWTTTIDDAGRRYQIVFVCSTAFPGYQLVNNPKYPNIVADYENTFKTLHSLPCDIFLGAHGFLYSLQQKQAALKVHPFPDPFVDPDGYQKYLETSQAAFEAELKKQQTAH